MLRAALPDTWDYAGCQRVDIYFDATTNTFTALELWDTADHYRAYLQYRTDQGIADAIAPLLEGAGARCSPALSGWEKKLTSETSGEKGIGRGVEGTH